MRKNDLHLRKKYLVPFEEYHNFKGRTIWLSDPWWPFNRTSDGFITKQEGKDF